MLDLRKNALLKLDEDDFLSNDSKEILKFMIKNKELDKITIDKIKKFKHIRRIFKGFKYYIFRKYKLKQFKKYR